MHFSAADFVVINTRGTVGQFLVNPLTTQVRTDSLGLV